MKGDINVPKIFISYRRADSEETALKIREKLVSVFDETDVFLDTHGINIGEDFEKVILTKIRESDVMLAVIGKQWLTIKDDDEDNPRIDNEEDYVHKEVVRGLDEHKVRGLLLIPVLVDDAEMPKEQKLPNALKPLASIHGAKVSKDSFDKDMLELIKRIQEVENLHTPPKPDDSPVSFVARFRGRQCQLTLAALLCVIIPVLLVLASQDDKNGARTGTPAATVLAFYGFDRENAFDCWKPRWNPETGAFFNTHLTIDDAHAYQGTSALRLDYEFTRKESVIQIERRVEDCGLLPPTPGDELNRVSAHLYLPEGTSPNVQAEFFAQDKDYHWYTSPAISLAAGEWVRLVWDQGEPSFATWDMLVTWGIEIKGEPENTGSVFVDAIQVE